MRIGIVLICRYTSTRLPGKILKKINGKPIIQYIIERITEVSPKEQVVVCTSDQLSDNPIVEYCNENKLEIFRGSLENVAHRFKECANHYKFDYACRINGDNIFVDIDMLQKMNSITASGQYNFISNVKDRTFPKGMSLEFVRTSYYNDIYKKFSKEGHFEHVTKYLYENPENDYYFHYNSICPESAGIQLAIDTMDDFKLAAKIISSFKHDHTMYGLKDIYNLYKVFKS